MSEDSRREPTLPNGASDPQSGPAPTPHPQDLDDATIAVSVSDETIAVAANDKTIFARQRPTPAQHHELGGTGRGVRVTTVGAPVVEREEIPPELAKLLFKNPLDPKRRAPESPFPREDSSLPRGGVRAGIPIAYGPRAEELVGRIRGTDFARGLGSPPEGYALPEAVRDELPSTARFNRTFTVVAWLGVFAVPIVAGTGLWWVLSQLLRS